MIKLEDVSTRRLMDYVKRLSNKDKTLEYVYELLVLYDVEDYQRLKDLLNSGNPEFNVVYNFLSEELLEVERDVKNANLLGVEPQIFCFDDYSNSLVDDKTLSITDKSNNGDVLLYTSPMVRGGARVNQLKYMSIDEIKHLSSHLNSYKLQNALTLKRNFGIDTVERVVDRVKLYEQQVLRQASETSERGINLFMLNKKTKDEIVESEIKDIVEYIVDNATECVWGSLSSTQKLRLMKSVLPSRSEGTLHDKMALINVISNYTTLSELEQGVIKKKTLDRFIVR